MSAILSLSGIHKGYQLYDKYIIYSMTSFVMQTRSDVCFATFRLHRGSITVWSAYLNFLIRKKVNSNFLGCKKAKSNFQWKTCTCPRPAGVLQCPTQAQLACSPIIAPFSWHIHVYFYSFINEHLKILVSLIQCQIQMVTLVSSPFHSYLIL